MTSPASSTSPAARSRASGSKRSSRRYAHRRSGPGSGWRRREPPHSLPPRAAWPRGPAPRRRPPARERRPRSGPPPSAPVDAALADRAAELLALPELASWFIDPESVQSDALALLESRESRLVVSDQIKAEREAAIVDRIVERELVSDVRRRWTRRLD